MRRKQKVGVVGCGARGSCGGYSRSIALLFLAELSPPPPPPPVVKKPSKQSRSKALKEDEVDAAEEALTQGRAPTVHSSSSTPQRPQPSKEPKMHSSTPQHPQPSKEPTVHSSTPQRPQPSREIRNIIRMYQSRPGPVPVPVQPSRWALGARGQNCFSPLGSSCALLTFSFFHEAC